MVELAIVMLEGDAIQWWRLTEPVFVREGINYLASICRGFG